MPARVLKELCQGCGICTQVCPAGAVSLNGGYAAVEVGKCEKDCEECIFACPNGAITSGEQESDRFYGGGMKSADLRF
jgi:MinD superfamily P-loop ATPase